MLNLKTKTSIKTAVVVLGVSIAAVFLVTAAVFAKKIIIYDNVSVISADKTSLTCDSNGCGSVNLTATIIAGSSDIGSSLVIFLKVDTHDLPIASSTIEVIGIKTVQYNFPILDPGSYVFKAGLYNSTNAIVARYSAEITVTAEAPAPVVKISATGACNSDKGRAILVPALKSDTLVSWDSANADKCDISINNTVQSKSSCWSGVKGSCQTGSINGTKTYTATCTNKKGSVSDSISVTSVGSLNPTVNLSVKKDPTSGSFGVKIVANATALGGKTITAISLLWVKSMMQGSASELCNNQTCTLQKTMAMPEAGQYVFTVIAKDSEGLQSKQAVSVINFDKTEKQKKDDFVFKLRQLGISDKDIADLLREIQSRQVPIGDMLELADNLNFYNDTGKKDNKNFAPLPQLKALLVALDASSNGYVAGENKEFLDKNILPQLKSGTFPIAASDSLTRDMANMALLTVTKSIIGGVAWDKADTFIQDILKKDVYNFINVSAEKTLKTITNNYTSRNLLVRPIADIANVTLGLIENSTSRAWTSYFMLVGAGAKGRKEQNQLLSGILPGDIKTGNIQDDSKIMHQLVSSASDMACLTQSPNKSQDSETKAQRAKSDYDLRRKGFIKKNPDGGQLINLKGHDINDDYFSDADRLAIYSAAISNAEIGKNNLNNIIVDGNDLAEVDSNFAHEMYYKKALPLYEQKANVTWMTYKSGILEVAPYVAMMIPELRSILFLK